MKHYDQTDTNYRTYMFKCTYFVLLNSTALPIPKTSIMIMDDTVLYLHHYGINSTLRTYKQGSQ